MVSQNQPEQQVIQHAVLIFRFISTNVHKKPIVDQDSHNKSADLLHQNKPKNSFSMLSTGFDMFKKLILQT